MDSRAINHIKQYLERFKHQIIGGGDNLKTPTFHQMLYVVGYIIRHACLMNYDGSRRETFGTLKIKDNAKFTNIQKDTLNFILVEEFQKRILLMRSQQYITKICATGHQLIVMKLIL